MGVSSNKRNWIWVLVAVAVVGLAICLALVHRYHRGSIQPTSEYQAVFLSNGQVYFGQLELRYGWAVLRDIYYLQVTQNLQQASGGTSSTAATPANSATPPQSSDQQVQLVKLGSELHGPQDEMFIARDKILFWENMSDSSKVFQSIKQSKAQ